MLRNRCDMHVCDWSATYCRGAHCACLLSARSPGDQITCDTVAQRAERSTRLQLWVCHGVSGNVMDRWTLHLSGLSYVILLVLRLEPESVCGSWGMLVGHNRKPLMGTVLAAAGDACHQQYLSLRHFHGLRVGFVDFLGYSRFVQELHQFGWSCAALTECLKSSRLFLKAIAHAGWRAMCTQQSGLGVISTFLRMVLWAEPP